MTGAGRAAAALADHSSPPRGHSEGTGVRSGQASSRHKRGSPPSSHSGGRGVMSGQVSSRDDYGRQPTIGFSFAGTCFSAISFEWADRSGLKLGTRDFSM